MIDSDPHERRNNNNGEMASKMVSKMEKIFGIFLGESRESSDI